MPAVQPVRLLLLLSALLLSHECIASAPDAASVAGAASGAGRTLHWLSPPPPPPVPVGTYYQNSANCTLTGIEASSLGTDSTAYSNFRLSLVVYFGVSQSWEVALTTVTAASSSSATVGFTIRSGGSTTGSRIKGNLTSLVANASPFLAAVKQYDGLTAVTKVVFTAPVYKALVSTAESTAVPPYPSPPPPSAPPPFPAAPPGFSYVVPTFTNSSQQLAHISDVSAMLSSSNLSTANAAFLAGSLANSLNSPSSLLNANATAAAAVRESLLTALANGTSLNGSSSDDLDQVSKTVVSLVANASQISPGGAVAALSLLSSVASAGTAVSNQTGHAVAASLSSLVEASRAPNSSLPVTTFGAVLNVVNSLSSSLLVGINPGDPPQTIVSDHINLLVQVDAKDDNRLFTASFAMPGSSSPAFQPLPASLLSNSTDDLSAGVATTFKTLSFDPYATVYDPDHTGVTTLALTSQTTGNPVNISGLADPIYFTLPAPKLAAGEVGAVSAQCQFWDTVALQYSSAGCVTQPDPQPPSPDHDIQWADAFSAQSDADMLNAWTGTGPLYTGCTTQVLDCSAPSPGAVFPNPASPFEVPAVSCGVNNTTPMLVFVGSTCQLLNTSNAYNCSWDNYLQSFVGGGCEITGDGVQCACRHLTDFAGASRYNIPVATPSEMASLDPGELLTRLRLLFIVVCSLFGFMNVGALYGWGLDRTQMRKFMGRICTPECGFRVVKAAPSKSDASGMNDVWLWRFHVEPLRGKIDAPAGPAVQLSVLLGLPAARLRAAIPDDLLSWTMANAVGRDTGFSAEGFTAELELQQRARSSSCCSVPKPLRDMLARRRSNLRSKMETAVDVGDLWPADEPPEEEEVEYDPERMRLEEEFVGTGLVLAFIQVAQLMPVVEHAKRKSAAKHYFGEFRTRAGWDFDKVCTDFVTLLSPGILNTGKWLIRARMWRLIMCQETTGAWQPSSSAAFALEARSLHEVQSLSHSLWARVMAILGLILSLVTGGGGGGGLAGGGLDADDMGDAMDDKPQTADELEKERKQAEQEAEEAKSTKPPNALARRWREHKAKKEAARRAKAQLMDDMAPVGPAKSMGRSLSRVASILSTSNFGPQDCPLTHYETSITDIMPRRLAHLEAQGVDVRRVWTSLCCISMLEDLPFSWIWGDGDTYPEIERTIVDAGREWVEQHAVEHPALAEALADGLLVKRAKAITAAWHATQERRVEELRRSEGITKQMAASQSHRTITNIVRAFVTQNDTFAVFLSEPLDGLQRWQMFMIIVTLVCSHLLVNIWMFYAKAVNCCVDIRAVLDGGPDGGNCPPSDFNAPCRGFTGECGALEDQFANVAVLPTYPNGMVDYDCHAFPDANNPLDSFIVGLISIAIALPVGLFLESCFEIANDSEQPESILIWSGWRKLVCGTKAHRQWHYTRGKQPSRYVRWWLRSQDAPTPETVVNLFHSARAYFTGTLPPWTIEAREAEEEAMAEQVNEVLDETLDEALEAASGSQRACSDAGSEHSHNEDGSEHGEGGSGRARSESGGSTSESIEEARELRLYKRLVMSTGLLGVYICWAVFAWFIFTYGSLIYTLLGQKSEGAFARSWGISYGLNCATEWRGIIVQAAKGAIVLAVLERLCLTRPQPWLEDAVDYESLKALMFKKSDVGLTAKIRTMYLHTKRIQ